MGVRKRGEKRSVVNTKSRRAGTQKHTKVTKMKARKYQAVERRLTAATKVTKTGGDFLRAKGLAIPIAQWRRRFAEALGLGTKDLKKACRADRLYGVRQTSNWRLPSFPIPSIFRHRMTGPSGLKTIFYGVTQPCGEAP
jgi:hypothetical protein